MTAAIDEHKHYTYQMFAGDYEFVRLTCQCGAEFSDASPLTIFMHRIEQAMLGGGPLIEFLPVAQTVRDTNG